MVKLLKLKLPWPLVEGGQPHASCISCGLFASRDSFNVLRSALWEGHKNETSAKLKAGRERNQIWGEETKQETKQGEQLKTKIEEA